MQCWHCAQLQSHHQTVCAADDEAEAGEGDCGGSGSDDGAGGGDAESESEGTVPPAGLTLPPAIAALSTCEFAEGAWPAAPELRLMAAMPAAAADAAASSLSPPAAARGPHMAR